MPLDNRGILADVYLIPGEQGGMYDNVVFLFSGGFYISGYVNDTLWAAAQSSASLVENFIPGNVDSSQYDPRYILYVVAEFEGDFAPSWEAWQFAVSKGAKFYDGNNDGIYNPVDLNGNGEWDPNEDRPDLIGDLTAWCVYNDGQYPRQRYVGAVPVGIEVKQTVFGYGSGSDYMDNTIFIRYEIENKGTVSDKLDSVRFSIWADPDLGDHTDDLVGSDTLLQSGYIYNNGDDSQYGSNPPAFFMSVLQGAPSYIPGITYLDNNGNGMFDQGDTPLDSAYNLMGKIMGYDIFPGARNSELTAFTHYQASDPQLGDPNTMQDARNYMNGLDRAGNIINPCTWSLGNVLGGVNCSEVNPYFWYSGDPVTSVGWINTAPTDQRTITTTGSFSLEVDKPVTIIAAYVVGQGTDAINSITKAREYLTDIREFYSNNFGNSPLSVDDELNGVEKYFQLYQNYPNPFNPTTKISWQSPVGSHQTLKVYDILGNEIVTLVDEYKPAGNYEAEFDASGLPSGVYFYQIKAGNFIESKKMILLK